MKKKIILFSLFLLVAQMGFGQKNARLNKISIHEQVNFNKKAIENIKKIHQGFESIANALSPKTKQQLIEGQLKYFVDSATVQTEYKNQKGKLIKNKPIPIKEYITVYKAPNTDIVHFEVSELKPVPNSLKMYCFDYKLIERGQNNAKKSSKKELLNDANSITKKGKMYIEKIGTKKQIIKMGSICVTDASLKK